MNEWLSNLKVGDKVIVSGFGERNLVKTVSRLTKTQIILKDLSTKYKKTDGDCVGGFGYYGTYIREWSQEKQEEIKNKELRASLARKLENLNSKNMTLDQLKQVYDLIKSFSESEK